MRRSFDDIQAQLQKALLSRKCPADKAEKVAYEITRNSLEGTYTHGVNRFPRLLANIDEGMIRLDADPVPLNGFGALQNLDGQCGLGITNAWFAMESAIALAKVHGVGVVGLRNTNHWLRAATYGYQACAAGMAGICFTNTMPNMPTWGAIDRRLGNNPLVMALPREKGPLIVDMAMSQFSYGALELAKLEGRQMRADAGFDEAGELTRDPAAVMRTGRVLPTGYWKGAGLSLLLDAFAACLSLGNTVAGIGRLRGGDQRMSQVFIAMDYAKIAPADEVDATLDDLIAFLLDSEKADDGARIVYPGQRAEEVRKENLAHGIPVNDRIWAQILEMS